MKTKVYCEHILMLSKKVARPHRVKRGNTTLVCCHKCATVVIGPVADLVFETVAKAQEEAKRLRIVRHRLDLQLVINEEGIKITRLERKANARRVKPWAKPDVTAKEVPPEGAPWRVIKCNSQ